MKSIEDKLTTIDNPIVEKAYIGNQRSLQLTSTTADVKGRKITNITLRRGKTTVKNEQMTLMATKNDIKDMVLVNVFCFAQFIKNII